MGKNSLISANNDSKEQEIEKGILLFFCPESAVSAAYISIGELSEMSGLSRTTVPLKIFIGSCKICLDEV